jgi:peptidoglycan/LPS O-acetylase OafA/YrhL
MRQRDGGEENFFISERGDLSYMNKTEPISSRNACSPTRLQGATSYRPEIDGLRALAVLAVLFFHLGFSGFSGGFIGVDVFFTISGYLITRQIVVEMESGRFSLIRFYERRIRRLVPALLVMLAATLAVGAILYLPQNWAQVARSAASAAVFLSNISYWLQIDYFEGDAKARTLLHTWSLGIEEQFYLTYPIMILGSARWGRVWLLRTTVILAALSFVASVWMVSVSQSTAFYLLPYRGWEFLVGALLALTMQGPLRSIFWRVAASWAGFFLIAYSIYFYDDMTLFPGIAALLPCSGAVLFLLAGSDSPSGKILVTVPFVFVGRISYSIYLWHWPVIVFVNYATLGSLSVAQNFGLAIVSIFIGYLSWRFIEMPFRTPKTYQTSRTVFFRSGMATIAVCVLAAVIYFAQGVPQRFPPQTVKLASYTASVNPEGDKCGDVALQLAPNSVCTIGNAADAETFLWGDSHAGALFGALENIATKGKSTIYGATPQCPPLENAGTSIECLDGNQKRLQYVLSHPEIKTVILAARWTLYLDGRYTAGDEAENNIGVPTLLGPDLKPLPLFSRIARAEFRHGLSDLVATLLANDKHVILVYPVPETGFNIPITLALISNRGNDPASFTTPRSAYYNRQSRVFRILNGIGDHRLLTRIYPAEVLCPNSDCLTYANGSPLYFDSHHLSIPGAQMLRPRLERAMVERNPHATELGSSERRSFNESSRLGGRLLPSNPVG